MNILAIDTSSLAASVCILQDNRPKGEFYCDARLTHSQTIMSMTENILSCTRTKLQDIDVFAVSKGPGSFTGLRIGLSAVKGMAQVLGKPCVAVSTLEALAYNLDSHSGIACAVMDARCNQVYTALFDIDNNMERLTEDMAISIEELKEKIINTKKDVILVGDGALLCYNNFGQNLDSVKIAPESIRLAHASSVAICAKKYYELGENTLCAEKLVPSYLRLPQAQRELIKKNKEKSVQ